MQLFKSKIHYYYCMSLIFLGLSLISFPILIFMKLIHPVLGVIVQLFFIEHLYFDGKWNISILKSIGE